MVRRGEEKGMNTVRVRNEAVSKTFREKNGLSPPRAAFKCFDIGGLGIEREHLLNAVLFHEFGRLFVCP